MLCTILILHSIWWAELSLLITVKWIIFLFNYINLNLCSLYWTLLRNWLFHIVYGWIGWMLSFYAWIRLDLWVTEIHYIPPTPPKSSFYTWQCCYIWLFPSYYTQHHHINVWYTLIKELKLIFLGDNEMATR